MSILGSSASSFVRLSMAPAFALLLAMPVAAQSNRVVLVEEHWELKLGHPQPDVSAPQITMFMSPTASLDGLHFLFSLNHVTAPSYQPGGMQVQRWDDGVLTGVASSDVSASLDNPDETITWVQRLKLHEGVLSFQVRDGHSQTWGDFGGSNLKLVQSTSLASLNGYRPGNSITESQVSYAENRVDSLTLKKLVWVTEDGEVHSHEAPIPVDTSLDN